MLAAVGSEIPWREFPLGLPALFTVMLMPLTWSITNGIGAGLILYTLLHARTAGHPRPRTRLRSPAVVPTRTR